MTYVPIRLIQLSSVQKKKQGHIPPISVPHPSATCKYRVEISFKPPRGCRLCTLRAVPHFPQGQWSKLPVSDVQLVQSELNCTRRAQKEN